MANNTKQYFKQLNGIYVKDERVTFTRISKTSTHDEVDACRIAYLASGIPFVFMDENPTGEQVDCSLIGVKDTSVYFFRSDTYEILDLSPSGGSTAIGEPTRFELADVGSVNALGIRVKTIEDLGLIELDAESGAEDFSFAYESHATNCTPVAYFDTDGEICFLTGVLDLGGIPKF